jgi:hypothetical protein
MFSGRVARGNRQLLSQMNDHHRAAGNQDAGQNPAYALLRALNKKFPAGITSRGFFNLIGFIRETPIPKAHA